MIEVETALAAVEAAVLDADATLSTDLGGHLEETSARLWRGEVLVDWQPDTRAGGCLLRPDVLRRLVALQARATWGADGLKISAPGRLVAALSPQHAELVAHLGGARRLELEADLRFEGDTYRGGIETYYLVQRRHREPLLRLRADVRVRVAPTSGSAASPRTSPAPR